MFRHKGKSRTYNHNFKLAAILSFVAGIVNTAGVLSFKVLTTNVTGHFAYFSEELSSQGNPIALLYLYYILSFLLGAFVSNFLIEISTRNKPQLSYIVPLSIEISILLVVALFGHLSFGDQLQGSIFACSLLFAMGLQNALVTKVSQSTVRTTHLTGLFTDLGIELSQLIFYRKELELQQLKKGIFLKLGIILGFFSGCVFSGLLFQELKLYTFMIAALFVLLALFYDTLLLEYYKFSRKFKAST